MGIRKFHAGGEMRIEEVRVIILRIHRSDGLAHAGLAVENGVPGVVTTAAFGVTGKIPAGTGQVWLPGGLGRVRHAAVGLPGEQGFATDLDGTLEFAGKRVGELRKEADARGVSVGVFAFLVILRAGATVFALGDVVGIVAEVLVGTVLPVETGALLGLVVAGHVIIGGLLAVRVFLAERRQPVLAGAIDGEGVKRPLLRGVPRDAAAVEVGRPRTVTAGAIADYALGAEGHILTTHLHIEGVEQVLVFEVEVIEEHDVRELLLAAIRLRAAVVAELVRKADVDSKIAGADLHPGTDAEAHVVRVRRLGMLVGGQALRDVVTEADIAAHGGLHVRFRDLVGSGLAREGDGGEACGEAGEDTFGIFVSHIVSCFVLEFAAKFTRRMFRQNQETMRSA